MLTLALVLVLVPLSALAYVRVSGKVNLVNPSPFAFKPLRSLPFCRHTHPIPANNTIIVSALR